MTQKNGSGTQALNICQVHNYELGLITSKNVIISGLNETTSDTAQKRDDSMKLSDIAPKRDD